MSIMFTGGYSPMFYAPSTSAVNSSGTANSSGAMNSSGAYAASGSANPSGAYSSSEKIYTEKEIQDLKDKIQDVGECIYSAEFVIKTRQEELKILREQIQKCKNDCGFGRITKDAYKEIIKDLYAREEKATVSLTSWQRYLQNHKNAYDNLQNELYIAVKSRQK